MPAWLVRTGEVFAVAAPTLWALITLFDAQAGPRLVGVIVTATLTPGAVHAMWRARGRASARRGAGRDSDAEQVRPRVHDRGVERGEPGRSLPLQIGTDN